ncbi:MAG: signal peptide peptidase SppA [Chromatiales bacterium]|nr:signal peptide peptidase SppA [Chromatiales bacterium]
MDIKDQSNSNPQSNNESWAQNTLRSLLEDYTKEQRRTRRWRIFYRLLIVGIIVSFVISLKSPEGIQPTLVDEHTALIKLEGPIIEGTPASAADIIETLQQAYESKSAKAVILQINSPGGSPVQSAHISDEILRLRSKYADKPCYAVISDIGASGAYYVAAAADAIYADRSSLVGSIGVIFNGFGLVDAIHKLGIERRVQKAGKYKDMLDPFAVSNPVVDAHMQGLLEQVHQQFINRVKQGRGDKLAAEERLFSGLIWTGEDAKDLGLIDNFASPQQVAREVVGVENIVVYRPHKDLLDRVVDRLGTQISSLLLWRMQTPALY